MASPLHIRKMSVFLNDVIQVLSQINPYLRYHCLYLSAVLKSLSRVRLLVTSWTVACQAPLSMGFSRQEYWSRLPFPPPVGLPNPGIEPRPPALQADSLPSEPPWKPKNTRMDILSHLPDQESNQGLLHCRWILYQLS